MSNVVTTVGQLKEAIRNFQDDAELHIMLTEAIDDNGNCYDDTDNVTIASSVDQLAWENIPYLGIWINKPLMDKSTI